MQAAAAPYDNSFRCNGTVSGPRFRGFIRLPLRIFSWTLRSESEVSLRNYGRDKRRKREATKKGDLLLSSYFRHSPNITIKQQSHSVALAPRLKRLQLQTHPFKCDKGKTSVTSKDLDTRLSNPSKRHQKLRLLSELIVSSARPGATQPISAHDRTPSRKPQISKVVAALWLPEYRHPPNWRTICISPW